MEKLILVDIDADMCIAWRAYFDGMPNVEIIKGRFESLSEFDCMVSAANSFGIMDGGVDLAIINFFGNKLMRRVQERIQAEYLSEQPIGTSLIVETGNEEHPFIAHTPTMRTPYSIKHTDNVYVAMWVMLLAVRKHNQIAEKKINVVACPGLGTGYGRMPCTEAARQMALAYRNYIDPPEMITMRYAVGRQKEIRYGGYDGFAIRMD